MLHIIPFSATPGHIVIPLLGRLVPAGFPSPADDYLEGEIDLSRYLVERPASTFLMRVSGLSMTGAGIMDGDLLVVDRSIEARPGHILVAVCNGDMTVKRLHRLSQGRAVLRADNPDFPDVILGEEVPAEIWGVVAGVVRKVV